MLLADQMSPGLRRKQGEQDLDYLLRVQQLGGLHDVPLCLKRGTGNDLGIQTVLDKENHFSNFAVWGILPYLGPQGSEIGLPSWAGPSLTSPAHRGVPEALGRFMAITRMISPALICL